MSWSWRRALRIAMCVFVATFLSSSSLAFSSTPPSSPSKSNNFSLDNPNSWSRIVQVDENGAISCSNTAFESPRDWMEHLEKSEGRQGAYTVLRCDLVPKTNSTKLWGREFHLQRLVDSYCALLEQEQSRDGADAPSNDEQLQTAIDTSNAILDALMEHASLEFSSKGSINNDDDSFIIMLTLLWQQDTTTKPSTTSICVRGHGYCNGKPVLYSKPMLPNPITATASILDNDELPNRYSNLPEAKLSSWCRTRRPLEQKFKVEGSQEVLLTQQLKDDIYILEGLTSNIFFVYPGDTIRTSNINVLKGCARKLVLESTRKLGFEYDSTPIRVRDADLWREVFVTSSIRLVVPVKEILIPGKDGQFQTLWKIPPHDIDFATCKRIYELLNSGE